MACISSTEPLSATTVAPAAATPSLAAAAREEPSSTMPTTCASAGIGCDPPVAIFFTPAFTTSAMAKSGCAAKTGCVP
eukprot:CAMPEP_0173101252 /NCGR_PEP_ID=MMETSP1102-20130122/36719_1 /TAXON_ID=49646 /ORGANISM="Geminigera sp., Strain Caron Lab Isolate" /LENGTH=77 /DNA_ID=CAMNT_0013994911 /DNA_START=347 /DNA_END=580 /DNA_ORIENTATION=+